MQAKAQKRKIFVKKWALSILDAVVLCLNACGQNLQADISNQNNVSAGKWRGSR